MRSKWKSLMDCLGWSQLAFIYSGMLRGTCFVTSGLTFTWVNTISWSERRGITEISSTRVGLVVKNRSSML